MKKLNFIHYIFGVALLLQSCYKDNSLLPDKAIDEIQIKTDATDTLNLYLGDLINIKTDPASAKQGTSYQWSMGTYSEDYSSKEVTTVFKEIGTDSDLNYKTTNLGHYYLRQVITNEQGSAIKYYHVFVNSEYEEGYLILSKRADGTGNLSFMKTLTPEEIAAGKEAVFRQNLFEYVNGEESKIGEGPVDLDVIDKGVFITSRDARKTYHIDNKSFKLEFTYDFRNYGADFVPLNLISYNKTYARELPVNSMNGGSAMLQRLNLEIFPYNEIPQNLTFDRSYDRPAKYSSVNVAYINSASGNIYANGFNSANMSFGFFPIYNFFEGTQAIQVFFNEEEEFVAVYKKAGETKIARMARSFTTFGPDGPTFSPLYDRVLSSTADLLTVQSAIQVNDIYSCLFFSNGGNVHKWYYNQDNVPANAFIATPNGEIVRHMNQSDDQKKLYVATYNPGRTGSKGSLYIYNSDTGQLLESYEGIADDPVKVLYKGK